MLEGVGDGFLGDHAEVVRHGGRDGRNGVRSSVMARPSGARVARSCRASASVVAWLGVAEVGDEVAGFALDAGDEAAAGFEEGAGFVFQWAGGGGVEAEGEAGEFLFEGVVKLAGDALALVERGLLDDFAFQAGDLAALLE
jgi:hypothetical protein